ncbi:MAG: DegV family protein [Clostridia bacterium]|nr:DegV family protein [Clostridia bacterium]
MYQLFCDSNCELGHTTVKEVGLNVIYMPYTLGDQEYFYDLGEKIDLKNFFDQMRAGASAKTSALNEYAYTEYFEPILARGEDIYYITFSHEMSGTFNAMKNVIAQLKEKYPEREIRFKDSRTISMANGLIAYYAALKYKEGATMDELDAYVDSLIPHFAGYFVVEDLTYLHRGGRLSGVSKVVGNLLGIKPVLSITKEGVIAPVAKVKGFKKALTTLREYVRTKGSELDKYKTFVIHADNEKAAEELAAALRQEYPNIDLEMQWIGPVIGAHCGPGTVGVMFHAKER